jgi:ATP-dependent HslUV protease subunit HslV
MFKSARTLARLSVGVQFPFRIAGRSTTILCVRKDGKVVMAGDGQVSQGSTVVKGNAQKIRKLSGDILVGFAGSTADALTLLERLERKLEEHPGQLIRACVELAKAWRSDKYLRKLEVNSCCLDCVHTIVITICLAKRYICVMGVYS